MDLAGQRVTVMGLGRFGGGVGVTRFLAGRGADVLVTDTLPAEALQGSLDQLADLPGVRYRLGGHRTDDFTAADLVVVNPAVPPGNPFVHAATEAGVPLTSEVRLLVRHLPTRLRTIGVTGSAGKSTVTAMIGHILEKLRRHDGTEARSGSTGSDAAPPRFLASPTRHRPSADHPRPPRVWVGGNLGGSLLPRVHDIAPDDWVVLELSSFMLEGLREDLWSPHIAVITNLAPNHLDWHGSMEAYAAAKQTILDFQRDEDGDWAFGGPGTHDVLDARVHHDRAFLEGDDDDSAIQNVHPPLPGRHNRWNARLACLAADAALGGESDEWFNHLEHLNGFAGLPHRLQPVGEVHGVRCYNDSKSTTPEAARLAIETFSPGTLRIILGGYDKGSDLTGLATLAAERCAGVYTIGATGDTIADAGEKQGPSPFYRCNTLELAVSRALNDARASGGGDGSGEVLVLSPGCASWDQFTNYEERGARFLQLLHSHPDFTPP